MPTRSPLFSPPELLAGSVWAGRSVGLLGGSFNPAHDGHRHICLEAMKRIGLDAVWLMVSPQNPLKPRKGMAPLETRMAGAREIASHPRMIVTDIETALGTQGTAATLKKLKRHFPATRFVWLMGADNLHQIDRWENWQNIFRQVPVAVLDRPPFHSSVRQSRARLRFEAAQIPESSASQLPQCRPPAWTYLHIPLNALSATEIRTGQKPF